MTLPAAANKQNTDAPSVDMNYCCRSTLLLAENESFLARKSAALFGGTLDDRGL